MQVWVVILTHACPVIVIKRNETKNGFYNYFLDKFYRNYSIRRQHLTLWLIHLIEGYSWLIQPPQQLHWFCFYRPKHHHNQCPARPSLNSYMSDTSIALMQPSQVGNQIKYFITNNGNIGGQGSNKLYVHSLVIILIVQDHQCIVLILQL